MYDLARAGSCCCCVRCPLVAMLSSSSRHTALLRYTAGAQPPSTYSYVGHSTKCSTARVGSTGWRRGCLPLHLPPATIAGPVLSNVKAACILITGAYEDTVKWKWGHQMNLVHHPMRQNSSHSPPHQFPQGSVVGGSKHSALTMKLFDSSDSENFDGYVATTINPGWGLTYWVIGICTAVNLLLPILVRLERSRRAGTVRALKSSHEEQNLPEDDHVSLPASIASENCSVASDETSDSVVSKAWMAVLNAPIRKGHVPSPFNPEAPYVHAHDERSIDSTPSQSDTSREISHNGLEINAVPGDDQRDEEAQRLVDQLLEIADWDGETKALVKLFVPYTLQAGVTAIFSMIDIAILGHFLGVGSANAFVMVETLKGFTGTINYGFSTAIGTLAPQADGAGNDTLVGRYLQLSIIFNTIFSLPGAILWAFITYDTMLWFGYDHETAKLAQRYVYPYLVGALIEGLQACLVAFLDVMEYEKYATFVSLFEAMTRTAIFVGMAACGVNDLVFMALVQTVWSFAVFFANVFIILSRGWLDPYWEGCITTFSMRDGRAVRTMLATAIPMSFAWILTYGEWEVLTIFAAYMGPAEVSAWGLIGYLWSFFEYTTGALSDASEARVGYHMGAGQPRSARLAAYKAIYLGLLVAIFSTGILFLLAQYIPKWLTPDLTLQGMLFEMIPMMGFGQVSMAVGIVCWGCVGAQGRVRLATTVEMVSSWVIVIPVSVVFVYALNYNLLGMVAALVTGYTVGGIALSFIVLTSDWEHLSKEVVARSEEEKSTDESSPTTNDDDDVSTMNTSWKDLSARKKRAAILLGFDQESWETDHRSSTGLRTNWDGLNRKEQAAAKTLEYSEESWNETFCDPTEEQEDETLELAHLSDLVYEFKGHPDTYCAQYKKEHVQCHWYYHDTKLGTQVMLVSNKKLKYLAIVYAGTDDVKTSLEDIDIAKVPFGNNGTVQLDNPDILIHKGFNSAVFVEGVFDQVFARLQQLQRKHPKYKLYTTGHSLGAANAVLTATALSVLGHEVVSINFGCPRTGNVPWRDFLGPTSPLNAKLGIWRVVLGWDLVPRLPDFFDHVGHTIQLWGENHYKYDKESPDVVECYYKHYGDAAKGYAGTPSGWQSKPYAWVPGAIVSHHIAKYVEYLEVLQEKQLWVEEFKKVQPIAYDDDIYNGPPDDWYPTEVAEE
eukprot:Nitzschia sp. Nitz4//scaffold305_size22082//6383//10884//NITZ4_008581-RA/size22082-processed-gene-0.1-mRNA-1//1//CDS//3329547086//6992//frame0